MDAGVNYSEAFYSTIVNDIDALKKNVEDYPYSAFTNYLLLVHCRNTSNPEFEKLAKKTALYFNNKHWLQFQLSAIDAGLNCDRPENRENFRTQAVENNFDKTHFAIATEEQLSAQNDHEQNKNIEEVFIPETQTLGFHIEAFSETSPQPGYANDYGNIAEEEPFIPDTQTLGLHVESEPYDKKEMWEKDNGEPENNMDHEENFIPDTGTIGSDFHENINDTANEKLEMREESADGTSIPAIEKSIFPDDEPVAFEPLHTIDYFASQGIKIPEEALTTDKLSNQMKSFTEWLRSMKKLHPEKLAEQNSLAETIIQSAAESSNIDTEVLTEAMAEVLIKQDKKEKAIEMYHKLSLINPSKSAYFAAKIESIKST
ncbi:MAG: hypothetical protein M3Z92_03850 [Bacteroidota bacterium]|nr:hypothetical protein [Bacteroidota bacterium]